MSEFYERALIWRKWFYKRGNNPRLEMGGGDGSNKKEHHTILDAMVTVGGGGGGWGSAGQGGKHD